MLTVHEHSSQRTTILELSECFDTTSQRELEAALVEIREMGSWHVMLNFRHISYIDSAGLGQLFLWYHNLRHLNIRLSIMSPQLTVRHLLVAAHLQDIIPIFESCEEAVQSEKFGRLPIHAS